MEEGLYLDNTTENEMADNATFGVDDGAAAVNDIDNNDYTEGNDNTGEVLENTENTNATVAANNGEDITRTQAFSKTRGQNWRTISRKCRRRRTLFSWKMKWTSAVSCIRQ